MNATHMNTYQTVFGALPTVNPWWGDPSSDSSPEFSEDDPRKWIGWTVTLSEVDLDTDDPRAPALSTHTFTHADVVRACEAILGGIEGYSFRDEVTDNCKALLYGDTDDVDFDSGTADVVLQIAAFGDVRYS